MKNLIYILLSLNVSISPVLKPSLTDIIPVLYEGSSSEKIDVLLDNIESNYDIPDKSGKVKNLPWRNDEDFLNSKEKYNTPILLTAYCAVLKNPLPGEHYNVKLASEKAKGLLVKSGDVFSQNMNIGPYTKLRGFKEGASYIGGEIIMTEGGGVCKIATTFYNLATLSNLEIVERHNHSMPINYVPYGQDATVAYGVKDLRFRNTTDSDILIWSEMIGNRLYMAFYGNEHSPDVVWNHEKSDIIKPSTKYITNEKLSKGTENIISEGMDGATVKSTVKIVYSKDHYIIKDMGFSKYSPLPRLIETN